MEVKKAGKYKMRSGELCEVYGFDDLGGGTQYAEGFDLKERHMKHWDPETGKIVSSWAKQLPGEQMDQFDIIEAVQ